MKVSSKVKFKKQLHGMGIKTYKNNTTGSSYVKKSDLKNIFANVANKELTDVVYSWVLEDEELFEKIKNLAKDIYFEDLKGEIKDYLFEENPLKDNLDMYGVLLNKLIFGDTIDWQKIADEFKQFAKQ